MSDNDYASGRVGEDFIEKTREEDTLLAKAKSAGRWKIAKYVIGTTMVLMGGLMIAAVVGIFTVDHGTIVYSGDTISNIIHPPKEVPVPLSDNFQGTEDEFKPFAKYVPPEVTRNDGTYDYILIGGGAGGLSFADELSTKSTKSILILEAGGNYADDPYVTEPKSSVADQNPDNLDKYYWQMKTTPQPQCANREILGLAGKMLDGSAGVNYQFMAHPSKADNSEIQSVLGSSDTNNLWSDANILEARQNIEHYDSAVPAGPFDISTPALFPTRSISGRFHIRDEGGQSMFKESWLQSFVDVLNVPRKLDYNDAASTNRSGVYGTVQLAHRVNSAGKEVRQDPVTAWFRPGVNIEEKAPDLYSGLGDKVRVTIRTRSTVDRIIGKPTSDGKQEYFAVTWYYGGHVYFARARHEIVVSAGLHSTIITQRSGIGNKTQLEELGMQETSTLKIVDSPHNGRHFQAHPLAYQVVGGNATFSQQLSQFRATQGSIGTMGVPFASTPFARPGEVDMVWFAIVLPPDLAAQFGGPLIFDPTLLKPRSEGYVLLTSLDPTAKFDFNPNTVAHPDDVKAMVWGLQKSAEVVARFAQLNPGWGIQQVYPYPGMNLTDYVITQSIFHFHYVGTMRMANSSAHGVVDAHGKPFGTERLRIADLSILPIMTTGNTAMPAMIVGRLIAKAILKGWGSPTDTVQAA